MSTCMMLHLEACDHLPCIPLTIHFHWPAYGDWSGEMWEKGALNMSLQSMTRGKDICRDTLSDNNHRRVYTLRIEEENSW
jgi:hypothetical protein